MSSTRPGGAGLPDHLLAQRWAALLHHSPERVRRVYAGPVEGLPERVRGWLTTPDPRAWGVDVQLRSRALQAVIEELPASAALSATARGGLAGLTAFFDGEEFAACVLQRGSMAEAFGRFAEADAGPVAIVEAAIAAARRRVVPSAASGEIVRGRVVAIRAPEGSSQRMEVIRASLGAAPAVTMATPRWRLPALPPLGAEAIPLLVEARGQRVAVSVASDALHALLDGLTEPVPVARARALAIAAGADSEAEATEILFDLVEEGLLVVG